MNILAQEKSTDRPLCSIVETDLTHSDVQSQLDEWETLAYKDEFRRIAVEFDNDRFSARGYALRFCQVMSVLRTNSGGCSDFRPRFLCEILAAGSNVVGRFLDYCVEIELFEKPSRGIYRPTELGIEVFDRISMRRDNKEINRILA